MTSAAWLCCHSSLGCGGARDGIRAADWDFVFGRARCLAAAPAWVRASARPIASACRTIRERIMKSDLDALAELTRSFAVEERRVEKDAAWDKWFDDSFSRRDFVLFLISIAILAFGIWWLEF